MTVGAPAGGSELSAIALICTLKPSPAPSSSDLMATQILAQLREQGVAGESIRVVDHHVRFGVTTDEGDGDEWPTVRAQILSADVLVLVTPIWMGQPASVCKLVLERLDAELAETDDEGRMSMADKVAIVGVVGNEDGAHHTFAACAQALNDVGVSLAANAHTYWVGEAMQTTDFRDLEKTPEPTAGTTAAAVRNAVHLAGLLRGSPYPA